MCHAAHQDRDRPTATLGHTTVERGQFPFNCTLHHCMQECIKSCWSTCECHPPRRRRHTLVTHQSSSGSPCAVHPTSDVRALRQIAHVASSRRRRPTSSPRASAPKASFEHSRRAELAGLREACTAEASEVATAAKAQWTCEDWISRSERSQ